MKFNNWFATGYGDDSRWDETISCELADEIERIDNANRRKRKALKQMIKAVERRTKKIEGLIIMAPKDRKFTAFEWFVLLLIVVLVVCLPLLAVIPQ